MDLSEERLHSRLVRHKESQRPMQDEDQREEHQSGLETEAHIEPLIDLGGIALDVAVKVSWAVSPSQTRRAELDRAINAA